MHQRLRKNLYIPKMSKHKQSPFVFSPRGSNGFLQRNKMFLYCLGFVAITAILISQRSKGTVTILYKNETLTTPVLVPKLPLIPPITKWCNRDAEKSCRCAKSDPLKPEKGTSKWGGGSWMLGFEQNVVLANHSAAIKGGLDVVLLGDSITEDWNGRRLGNPAKCCLPIKKVFESLFRKENGGRVNGIALGVSGDQIKHLLWRMEHGEIPEALHSKVYWLLIGTNNLSNPKCSAEVVVAGIIKCVEMLISKKPDSIIVLNSILPRTHRGDFLLLSPSNTKTNTNNNDQKNRPGDEPFDLWPVINTINQELESFAAKHDYTKFFNATDVFLKTSDGVIYVDKELMPDRLHPSSAGHDVWGNKMINFLTNEVVL